MPVCVCLWPWWSSYFSNSSCVEIEILDPQGNPHKLTGEVGASEGPVSRLSTCFQPLKDVKIQEKQHFVFPLNYK